MDADQKSTVGKCTWKILICVHLRLSAVKFLLVVLGLAMSVSAQMPTIEAGVPHELAKWRAARYSDVRYKLNLTLEKMSPVLKGTMEIRLKVSAPSAGGSAQSEPAASAGGQLAG